MPLLMIDLDNTLVDRDAAFREAASAFLDEHALPGDDLAWLMSVDAEWLYAEGGRRPGHGRAVRGGPSPGPPSGTSSTGAPPIVSYWPGPRATRSARLSTPDGRA